VYTTTATWPTVQIVEYTYDYNNIWIRKVVGDSKTIFIPEAYQTAVQIDNGTVSHHYLWTPNQQDKLLADTTPTEVLWSLTDHLGTIRDVLGATTTHLIYDAFGNLTSGTNPLLFGYTGKAFDTATHLQNNINRWYDAIVGRWLSIDPIGFEGNDINLYRYIKNCVTIHSDLMGFQASLFYTDPGLQIMQKNQEAFKENERKNTKSYFDYLKKLKPLCDGLDSCEAKKAGCSKQACLDYMAKVAGFMVKADYEAGGFRKFRASNRLLSWCFPDPYGGHCTLWTAMYMEHSSPWPQEACVVVKLHILSFTEGQWEVHSIIQLKNRFTGKNMLLDNGAWGHVYPPDEANPQQTPMVPESAQLLKDLMREEKDPLFHKTKETL